MKKEMQLPLANRQSQLTIWLLSTFTYKTADEMPEDFRKALPDASVGYWPIRRYFMFSDLE